MLKSLLTQYHVHLTLLLVLFITGLSLLPLPELPELPGKDKTGHLIAYAVCVLPISVVKPKNLVWILLAIFVWSGILELIQPYVNRYGEWLDWVANGTGILLGLIMGRGIGLLFFQHK